MQALLIMNERFRFFIMISDFVEREKITRNSVLKGKKTKVEAVHKFLEAEDVRLHGLTVSLIGL